MKFTLSFLLVFFLSNTSRVLATEYFIGSSAFMLVNLDEDDPEPPNFYQLNFGVRTSSNSSVSIEFIQWTYYAPLGIPWGDKHGDKDYNFPGSVEAKGVGLAFQTFLTKKFYTALHATYMKQDYKDENKEIIQSGNQLFMTLRFGYHMRFFNDIFFLEPSIAFTHWPVNTNLPDSFQVEEDKWDNHFLFEPGLHFGVNF